MPAVPRARLCKICKWDDYSGYGFSLHATRGKVGHFIGDVDVFSPAYAGGIRDNDFVVEVNGINVMSEPHQQVVDRIKELPDHVLLLVLDKEARTYFEEKRILVDSHMDSLERVDCPKINPYNDHNSMHDQPRTRRTGCVEIIREYDYNSRTKVESSERRAMERDSVADCQAREAIEQIEREVDRAERANGVSPRLSHVEAVVQSKGKHDEANRLAPNLVLIESNREHAVNSVHSPPSPKSRASSLNVSQQQQHDVKKYSVPSVEKRRSLTTYSNGSKDRNSNCICSEEIKDQCLCGDLATAKMRLAARNRKDRIPSSTFTERKKMFDQL